MKMRNISGSGRWIADTGQLVPAKGEADVPDALGESLCQQTDVWEQAKPAKETKPEPVDEETK